MWFKQLQVFNIRGPISRNSEDLRSQLEKMIFEPCKAHTSTTSGWVAPLDEEDNEALVYSYKNYRLFCLQIEEKVLPPYVIAQELKQRIRQIETSQARKVARREKYALSDANNAFELDEEQWTANFIIMVGVLNLLIEDLLKIFEKK